MRPLPSGDDEKSGQAVATPATQNVLIRHLGFGIVLRVENVLRFMV